MNTEIKIDEDGTKKYYVNGLLHKEDGPAVEYSNGDKEWWINGEFIKFKNNDIL